MSQRGRGGGQEEGAGGGKEEEKENNTNTKNLANWIFNLILEKQRQEDI